MTAIVFLLIGYLLLSRGSITTIRIVLISQEVLDRGKKLENIASLSSELSAESKRYRDKSRYLNRLAAFRKYAPLAVAGALSMVTIWWILF